MIRYRLNGLTTRLVSAVGILVLSGCAAITVPEATQAPMQSQEQVDPPANVQSAQQAPQVTALHPPQQRPTMDPVPEPRVQPEPAPLLAVPLPDNLIGYSADQIERLFGTPSFIRRDSPAELWQYKSAICIADLYLYDGGAGNFILRYLEFRQTDQHPESIAACLRVIIAKEISRRS